MPHDGRVHVRPTNLSVPAYFALEAAETVHRHEYWDGQIWAMTGSQPEHADLVRILVRWLDDARHGGPCRVYSENVRTRLSPTRYVYPDVVLACPPDFDRTTNPPSLLNPKVVVEVLSDSTAAFDRGDKLAAYVAVDSVSDVLLIDGSGLAVVHHRRQDAGWLVRTLVSNDPVALEDPSLTFRVQDLFDAARR